MSESKLSKFVGKKVGVGAYGNYWWGVYLVEDYDEESTCYILRHIEYCTTFVVSSNNLLLRILKEDSDETN